MAALGYAVGTSVYIADEWRTFTMVDGDIPYVAFDLAYPIAGLYIDVYTANPDGTKGTKVHSNYINYLTQADMGRFTGARVISWDGTYQGNSGSNGKTRRVADGDYVLEIRALKALGDPTNPDHWEIEDTVAFTIDYADGADTSSGNGPGNNKGTNNGKGKQKP